MRPLVLAALAMAAGCTTADIDDLGVSGAARTGVTPSITTTPRSATKQFSEAERAQLAAELNAQADPSRRTAAASENAAYRADVTGEQAGADAAARRVEARIASSGSADSGATPEEVQAQAAAREAELRKRLIIE